MYLETLSRQVPELVEVAGRRMAELLEHELGDSFEKIFSRSQQLTGVIGVTAEAVQLLVEGLSTAGVEIDGAHRREGTVVGQRPAGASESGLGSADLTASVGVLRAEAAIQTKCS